jgi:hypothetical protein
LHQKEAGENLQYQKVNTPIINWKAEACLKFSTTELMSLLWSHTGQRFLGGI